DVTFSALTISHGYAPDLGGGILNQGSNLTLDEDVLSHNVVFESLTSGGRGGALRSQAGTVTISGCQFTGNQTLGGADAAVMGDALGGGVYILAGFATITDTAFSGNLAQAGADSSDGFSGGGGLFTAGPLSITGGTFSDNLARAGDNAPDSEALGGGL